MKVHGRIEPSLATLAVLHNDNGNIHQLNNTRTGSQKDAQNTDKRAGSTENQITNLAGVAQALMLTNAAAAACVPLPLLVQPSPE